MSKLQNPIEVTVGENKFYIRPFPAFKAVNLSAEVVKLLAPVTGPILNAIDTKGGLESAIDKDLDLDKALPEFTKALGNLDGDDCEKLLRRLIIEPKTIAVDYNDNVVPLTEDVLNEIFALNTQNIFVLAFHVIKVNYGGFFTSLGTRFGSLAEKFKKTQNSTPTEN